MLRVLFRCAFASSVWAVAHACKSSVDCGLNGECSKGACVCDDGWVSTNCTVLDLRPVRAGDDQQAYMTNRSSWGGNVVPGADGKYHLFFSEMRQDGLHQFKYNSQATHAVGPSPLGPFSRVRVIRGPISHNVQPQIGPDGAVYIFMIGGDTLGYHGDFMVGRAEDASAEWEWAKPDTLHFNGTFIPEDNPSAVMYKNGTVLLVTRGISLFRADNWRGPYKMLSESILPCGEACNNEDPFIWQSPRGLHMIAHDHEPFPFHKQVITYAFTTDLSGINGWVFSYQVAADGYAVQFDDGSNHTFCSRQRPQLYFSEPAKDGVQHGRPLVLMSGVQRGRLTEKTPECGINNENASEYNPYFDYSFTLAQPVGEAPPSFVVV